MAELNSFGAVLSFAIQLEEQLQAYYQGLGNETRAKDAEKRRVKLERVRRENVVEITLEPIEDLHEEPYVPNWSDGSSAGQAQAERTLAQFYTDSAPKINVLQARRALERCAQEHLSAT